MADDDPFPNFEESTQALATALGNVVLAAVGPPILDLGRRMGRLEDRMDGIERRMDAIERDVQELRKEVRAGFSSLNGN